MQGQLRAQPVPGTRGPDGGPGRRGRSWGETRWPCFHQLRLPECYQGSRRAPLLSHRLRSGKTTQNKLYGSGLHGSDSCLLAQGSPHVCGVLVERSRVPQLARLVPGRGRRPDPVLPASTSVLLAGPLGPEVGVGWAEGEAASSFSSCLRGPPHPLAGGLSEWLAPKLCPFPRNGGGSGLGPVTCAGEATVLALFPPLYPVPHIISLAGN